MIDLDLVLAISKGISPLIGIALGAIYADAIAARLAPFASRLGSRKEGILGVWAATFTYGAPDNLRSYTEIIELRKSMGFIVGRIIPHADNDERLKRKEANGKTVEESRPVRVTGKLQNNHYLTGYWFHPSQRSHFQGAFQLMVDQSLNKMSGKWVGYSRDDRDVGVGSWDWTRLS